MTILTPALQDVDNINSTKYAINNSIENVMKMIADLQGEISNLRKQQGQVKETEYSTNYTEVKDEILGLYSILRDVEKRLDNTTNIEKSSSAAKNTDNIDDFNTLRHDFTDLIGRMNEDRTNTYGILNGLNAAILKLTESRSAEVSYQLDLPELQCLRKP